MIVGVVTGHREAVIPLTVRGPAGQQKRINAVIDTGFEGISVCRPHSSICWVFLGGGVGGHYWPMVAKAFSTFTKL